MMSYCDIADLALLSSWDDMQSLTTAQLQNLIDRGARWIRRYTKQDFANETNPDTLADLKWVNCLLAEYLWYFDQTDTKSATYQNIAGEKIGDYQYTTKLNNTTQIKKIGELTGNEELDSILVSLKIEIIGFNYFSLSGPSCGVRGGIPVSNGNSSDFNALVLRVDALEILVNENNVDVNARIDALQISLVDEMDNRMNAMDGRIDTLESDMTTLTTTVNTVSAQVDDVEIQANAAMVKATNAPLVELPLFHAKTDMLALEVIEVKLAEFATIIKDNANFINQAEPTKLNIEKGGVYIVEFNITAQSENPATIGSPTIGLVKNNTEPIYSEILRGFDGPSGIVKLKETIIIELAENDFLSYAINNVSNSSKLYIHTEMFLTMTSGDLPA